MKKRLFWAILALTLFCLYSVAKLMLSDFVFATHSARILVLESAILASPFVLTVALVALRDKIKLRAKKLIPTAILTFGLIAFIVAEFGILGGNSSFTSAVSGIFLIFGISVLAIRGNSFRIYFLVNVILALIGFVASAFLCFAEFQPSVFGAASYGILSNLLYGICCDAEPESEEETLLKFEENVKKLCDLS